LNKEYARTKLMKRLLYGVSFLLWYPSDLPKRLTDSLFNFKLTEKLLVQFYFITIIAPRNKNDMINKLGHYGHHHHILFIGRP